MGTDRKSLGPLLLCLVALFASSLCTRYHGHRAYKHHKPWVNRPYKPWHRKPWTRRPVEPTTRKPKVVWHPFVWPKINFTGFNIDTNFDVTGFLDITHRNNTNNDPDVDPANNMNETAPNPGVNGIVDAVRRLADTLLRDGRLDAALRGMFNHAVRVKRSGESMYNKKSGGLTQAEKRILLDAHNRLRSQEGASNMIKMDWDEVLGNSAQAYARKCVWGHSKNRKNNIGTYSYVGENLYSSSGAMTLSSAVQGWFDEKVDYHYNTKKCNPGKVCGHYTQVVWADSRRVGCGVAFCNPLSGVSFGKGYYVVCQYGPGGNYVGKIPFIKGSACSKCPKTDPHCVNNMCYHQASGAAATGVLSTLLLAVCLAIPTSLP